MLLDKEILHLIRIELGPTSSVMAGSETVLKEADSTTTLE